MMLNELENLCGNIQKIAQISFLVLNKITLAKWYSHKRARKKYSTLS